MILEAVLVLVVMKQRNFSAFIFKMRSTALTYLLKKEDGELLYKKNNC